MQETKGVDIEALLEARYPAPKWATFRELRQACGWSHGEGRIDLAAFGLLSGKRGERSIGFEVKRSRGDFTRELRKPKKRLWVEQQFQECYFVVPVGLVSPDEIPSPWGLLIADDDGIQRAKLAKRRRDIEIGQHLVRSLLRRCAQAQADLAALRAGDR